MIAGNAAERFGFGLPLSVSILPPTKLPVELVRYWDCFLAAGQEFDVDPVLLASLCWRESSGGNTLTPRGPTGMGDKGNGLGLMQIDRRYNREWAEQRNEHGVLLWQIPLENIRRGAMIYARERKALNNPIAAVAAYNCDPIHCTAELESLRPEASPQELVAALDKHTTGHDYVAFVLAHRARWMGSWKPPTNVAESV